MSGVLLVGFIVEAWPRSHTKVQKSSMEPAYGKANLFSQITYHFYQPIVSLSVKRPLTMEDIANQLLDSNKTIYRLLGWSACVGMLTMAAMLPLQTWRAKIFGKMKREKWTHMDERIHLTTESLTAIKVVKLYTWENPFLQKILAVRNLELDVLRRIGILYAIMSIVFSSSTVLICLATLSVFAAWGGEDFTPGNLTPQIVFVSMTLFAMLKTPISNLTEASSETISLWVSTKRLETFLLEEEIDVGTIIREKDVLRAEPGEPHILIKDGAFSWWRQASEDDNADENQRLLSTSEETDESEATLKNISLAIERNTLVAVVGRVGQGKSSLISAIIGEMYHIQGYAKTIGRIAYVPQQAWILNATLRENILFGKEFDKDRYDRIVYACGLDPDIAMLPAGDMTEIGERGINLSGGQKQRVSLARAAYDDADIYLMDDPLSAVDAHVDRHLWVNLIGPRGLLRRKTRLLVTHGIHHLHEVDRIVLLKNGQIIEDGNFDELVAARQTFHQLIKEYSITHKAKSSPDDDEETLASVIGDAQPIRESSEAQGVAKISKDVNKDLNGKLVTVESIEVGEPNSSVVLDYISAASYKNAALVICLHVLAQACLVSTNLWLKYWLSASEQIDGVKENPLSLAMFLSVFAMLTIAHVATCILLYWITFAVAGIRASEHLHRTMITRIMRLPSSFFDTTPTGRIINRFSSDMLAIDDRVIWKISDVTLQATILLASLIVVAATTPIFLLASPIVFLAYYVIQKYYLHASRPTKRAFQITKSPIFQHLQETLNGVSTIRAMGLQDRFIQDNAIKIDVNANAFLSYGYSIRWGEVRIQLVSCFIVLLASLWFVLSATGTVGEIAVDAATAGLALSFAMNISQALIWFTRSYCDLYTHMTCVERVQEMSEIKTEAPLETDPSSTAGRAIKSGQWPPQQGSIEFIDYSTRYREGLDLVLKHMTFKVAGGEKIGIVGRTGAGKSSLTLALFRMIEAANSYWSKPTDDRAQFLHGSNESSILSTSRDSERSVVSGEHFGGRIEIDGVDISKLGLRDLRQQLVIIPQEPILFTGSIRENLDPFQELEDAILWEALERSHLKAHVSSLVGGLSFQVSQNGENFSVGQRSLICLARALLRKGKILVLDEATSAVDMETDELIQKTIRSEFKDRTILTIAHRIKTVMDADKILVLDQGSVVEYDSPMVLVQDEKSLFHKLAKQAGEI
ncbi:Multidrug resistance-associated protein 1 [Haplosporangium sp. Z 27]|nr:Multidrug resistance-associated protein 1 [Haplosporangium sp. Z 27]